MFTFEQVLVNGIIKIDDAQIEAGKITCITGPSGSGKSTLLKVMNRLRTPDHGRIYYKNQPMEEIDPIQLRREVVMLAQDPVLFGDTVRENAEAGRAFAELEEADEGEIKRQLEAFSLRHSLEQEANRLSGGEKQRLALARMMLMKPEVYLLDEPTSALDEKLEFDIMGQVVSQVQRQEGTMVFITHNQQVAETFADTIFDVTPFTLQGSDINE
ncbi:putative ABC transport system ATP-binding protein [Salsuginibacillus halophilus]|uniref:Putative ABC transport system ATP-binding protein n=1 Tax=Salsuginibacillus halophilus TaxID=517424 RepID=A0A2P8HDT9_9BACI|nr:ABC transporter ATP-binding protein [Salsuginibacillus halophilus]PSL44396.1 putative ABC transport system ATP-binding protein [Salsuginibacillus halophilus]